MMERLQRLVFYGSALALGCNSSNARVQDADVDASPHDGPVDGNVAQDASSDGSTMPPPVAIRAFDGPVFAALHAGSSWYVGGAFTRVSPYSAPYLAQIDLTGTAGSCLGGLNGAVKALAHSGASIYVGGDFTSYKGASANHIAKIDATTCALDPAFTPPSANGFDGPVWAVAISGSSLYVGGNFTAYKGLASSANGIAKLDLVSGALDTSFSPTGAVANGFTYGLTTPGTVTALVPAGAALYVGGSFTDYRGVAYASNFVAKLDLATGVLDTTFSPPGISANGFERTVRALVVSGRSLYVGGDFNNYRGVAFSANGVAKLDLTTGALDTTFSPPGATANGFDNNGVLALTASGNSLYVGGLFLSYRGQRFAANHLAKLDLSTGAIDTTFSPPGWFTNGFNDVNSIVYALLASGGSLYVGGNFNKYRNVADAAHCVAKLDLVTGALDTSFIPAGSSYSGFDNTVQAIAFDGTSLWLGGIFTVYAGHRINGLAKLDDATLALDTVFSPPGATTNGFGSGAMVMSLASSGLSLYVGGDFTVYRGVTASANALAKLDLVTGAIDTTFSPPGATSNGFTGGVSTLVVAAGSLYAGGGFTDYRGIPSSANRLAKLDLASGALDTTFSPPGPTANGFSLNGVGGATVYALASAGGSLYVGGTFTDYKGIANSANRLAKLDLVTGAIDTTFSPPGMTTNGFDFPGVNALATSGGSLYVGGGFSAYRGVAGSASSLAKLDLRTGALDTTFSPPGATRNGVNGGGVLALVASSSSLYLGGGFTDYRGIAGAANRVAKLDLTSGALDTTFSPAGLTANGFNDTVFALATFGTSLYAGGYFLAYRTGHTTVRAGILDLTTGAPK